MKPKTKVRPIVVNDSRLESNLKIRTNIRCGAGVAVNPLYEGAG